jgi:hypothetical protein
MESRDAATIPMITVSEPSTIAELGRAFVALEKEAAEYWSTFSTPAFFTPLGDAWGPATHVRHLTKSVRAVARGLSLPRPVLWMMFGPTWRASRSYTEMRTTYLAAVAGGVPRNPFAPSPLGEPPDPQAARARIMSQHAEAIARLVGLASRWPERAVDRARLPHPVLGKLTVREMLHFTLYHELHHVQVAARRAAGAVTGRAGGA